MKEFELSNINVWRQAGYTGKGIKVAVLDNHALGDIEKNIEHSKTTVEYVKLVAPNVEINYYKYGITSLEMLKTSDYQIIVMPTGGPMTIDINNLIRDIVYDKSKFFLVAAGNYFSEKHTTAPINGFAANSRVITVGAGHLVEGGDVVRPWYSMAGPSVYCISFANVPINGVRKMGTSYSTPFVGGALALYLEFYEETLKRKPPAIHIRRLIREYALDLEIEGRDHNTGYGLFRLPPTIKII